MSAAWFGRRRSSRTCRRFRTAHPYDKGAFEACLTNSVAEAVRLQAEAGIDVVSDGEYGKSVNWAFYVHRRLGGLEWRPISAEEAKDPMVAVISGRDREAFREFYAEYDGRVLRNASAPGTARSSPARSPIPGRRSCSTTSPISRRGWRRPKARSGFLPVVAPASALPNAKNEHYRDEESFLFAPRRGAAHRIPRDHRCRTRPPGRRCVPALHVRENGPAHDAGGIPAAGRSCASPRSTTPSRACRTTGRAITSAGAAGTGRTCSTCR